MYYAFPYVADLLLPNSLAKLPVLKNLAMYNLRNPKPDANRYLQPGGYDGYELSLELHGLLDYDWQIKQSAVDKFQSFNFPIQTVHGALAHDYLKKRYLSFNLADSNQEMIIRAIENQIKVTKQLCQAQPILVFHTAYFFNPDDQTVLSAKQRTISNLMAVRELAEKYEVYLGIENVFSGLGTVNLSSDLEFLHNLMNTINSPYIKITFDWGHANCQAFTEYCQGNLTRDDLINFKYHHLFLDALQGQIIYSHVHYNDMHLCELEYGDVDFAKMNRKLIKLLKRIDQHLPLTRIDQQYQEAFEKTFQRLLYENPLEKICLEIHPRKIFKVLPYYQPSGGTADEIEQSAGLFRKMLKTI